MLVVYGGEACALVARSGKRVGETAMGAQKDEKWPEGRSETALDGRAAQEQRRRKGKGKKRCGAFSQQQRPSPTLPQFRHHDRTFQRPRIVASNGNHSLGSEEGAKIALIFQQPCPAFNNESI